MSERTTLRAALIDQTDAQDRVLEPGEATAGTRKPFITIGQGPTVPERPQNAFGTTYYVVPNVDIALSSRYLDDLAEQIKAVLDETELLDPDDPTRTYGVEFVGAGQETPDDVNLMTKSRILRYQVYDMAWKVGRTFHPDPVPTIERLITRYFPEVGVNPLTPWRATDASPAVYVRLDQEQGIRDALDATEMHLRGSIRVIAPTAVVRDSYVRRIVELLTSVDALPIDPTDPDSDMFYFGDNDRQQLPQSTWTANPYTQGQIKFMVQTYVDQYLPPGATPPAAALLDDIFITVNGVQTEVVAP